MYLLVRKGRQDISFDHRLEGWSSDAKPDSEEFRSAEVVDKGNQPFMTSVASSLFQPDSLERQVQVIVNDYDILKVYPEIVCQFPDRDAAQIHERLRLGE